METTQVELQSRAEVDILYVRGVNKLKLAFVEKCGGIEFFSVLFRVVDTKTIHVRIHEYLLVIFVPVG